MATINEQITHLTTTKNLIKNAIIAKGVEVPDTTTFKDYATKIASISQSSSSEDPISPSTGDGWTRPTDRPAVPTVNENEIYMLFGVQPTGPNDYAITLTAIGGYTADWGDGTVDTVASATKCEHMYDYSTLDVTPNSNGIKWVWIKFSAISNSFTTINTNVRHSLRPTASSSTIFSPQVYEIYINASEVTTWVWGTSVYTRFFQLDIFDWQGTNKLTTVAFFLYQSFKLKQFSMYTGLSTDFSYFLYYCYSFNQPLNIDTSNGTDFAGFLAYCYSFNQPLSIVTSKGTNFNYFMDSCSSFNQPLNINTNKGNSFLGFMQLCYSYSFSLTIDLVSATTAIGTGFLGTYARALTGLRFLNMGSIHTAITISNSSLTADALVDLFNDLYDRSSTTEGTITITKVYGASSLTPEQKTIATNKNWKVTG